VDINAILIFVGFASESLRAKVKYPELRNHLGNMYWDSIIRVKNGLERGFERVKVPYSSFDMNILELLTKEGYIGTVSRKGRGVRRIIDIKLKYDSEGEPAIRGVKFVSRPSRRLYSGYRKTKTSRQGSGHYILSTPEGILTDKEARKKKVGGQVLFEIW